jgi:hypothetical protein
VSYEHNVKIKNLFETYVLFILGNVIV